MRKVLLAGLAVALAAGSAWAGGRPDKSHKNWFGHIGGGWSLPQGTLGDIVDDDWALNGGATYWPEAWPIGLELDLMWAEYDASSDAIRKINDAIAQDPMNNGSITGGAVEMWSGTLNALWSPRKASESKVGFYLAAGIGMHYVDAELHDTGLVYYPPVCDPWWWWCYPGGVGPGTFVTASESSTEFGWNAGIGITFDVGMAGSQIFVEAKYHSVDTPREAAEFVPLLVGYRW